MAQVIFDMLRGALALSLVVLAAVLIIYLIVPGLDFSPDRTAQRVARARSVTAMFGGLGIIFAVVFLTIGIMSGLNRIP